MFDEGRIQSHHNFTSVPFVYNSFPLVSSTSSLFSSPRIFFLDVPNDSVYERLTLRSLDPITGQRYHALYNPPRTVELKDRGSQHPKDVEDDVRQRLSAFYAYAEEIADFYQDAQHINADQDPHTVFECVESMLVNPTPTKLDLDD